MTGPRTGTAGAAGLVLVGALAGAAVVLTGLRLVDPAGRGWVLLTSFSPFGLPVAVLGLLVLLLLVLARCAPARAPVHATPRGPSRARGWVTGCLAVLLVVPLTVQGWWAATSYVPTRAADVAHDGTVRVATLNTFFGAVDPRALVAWARSERLDVLVLQEVTPAGLEAFRAAGVAEVLPHAVGDPDDGPRGTVLLSREPWEDPRALPMAGGGWSALTSTPAGGLAVVGVHALAPLVDAAAWSADHEVVRQEAARLRRAAGVPVVVAGDLNATAAHAPVRALEADGWVRAADAVGAGPLPTWPSGGAVRPLGVPLPPLLGIDHVLTGPGATPVEVRRAELPGTDHRAVVTVLGLA